MANTTNVRNSLQVDTVLLPYGSGASQDAVETSSYFGTLDDELVIRILGHLGSTVCLGAAPEPRAALLPIQPHPNHSNICNEAPLVAPELSIEFQKAPVAESSSVLLHTPQLQTHVATGLPHSCSGHASGSSSRRSQMVYDEPTPKPPPGLSSYQAKLLVSHPLSCGALKPPNNSAELQGAGIAVQEACSASLEAANATAMQALACTSRRFRRLVFTHACTACTCTVPTLTDHAANSMGPYHLNHFDLHRCGALLQDHHLISLPTAAKLCSLNLSHCASLTANSLMFLKNMASLTFLDLSYSRDVSPSGYCHLPTSLVHLNLSHMNEYRTPLFMHLTRLSGLQHLNLSCNDALITGLSGIENLCALTWLSIADCDLINDNDRFALASLLLLRSLDLGGTKISLTTLEFLVPLTELTHVCLDGCVKIRQRHIAWMRERSDAPAWDTAEVPADFHTVDPSSLILTADCATPVASSSRKRASSTLREGSGGLGAYTSGSSCSAASQFGVPTAGSNGYSYGFGFD